MPKPTPAEIVARRGLALPERTRSHLRELGIWCDPSLSIERKSSSGDWFIRGKESGGAVAEIGRYVGFCREGGEMLPWLYRVKNFMPNGVHAVFLAADPVVRLELYRYETSYDLLITRHWLHRDKEPERPKLWNETLFAARYGVIELELWGKDKRFRGGTAPRFMGRNGDEILIPEPYKQSIFKMVEAVTDIGCRQPHLLHEPEYQPAPKEALPV